MAIDYHEMGQRIAARRKALGLRQAQVCERCDINGNYLSNIERAVSIPSLEVLMRICTALDTTPDALLLGTSSRGTTDCARSSASSCADWTESSLPWSRASSPGCGNRNFKAQFTNYSSSVTV